MTTAAYTVIPVIALYGIPAVITVAILKHGLYQIDVIINRTIRYGLISAALTAVYVGIVVGIGTLAGYAGGPLLTAAAALAIAVLFQPLRRRAQLVANRIVYGQRATPYQVLADFAEDMAGQLDADAALERMSTVLAGATGAVRVEVWVRVGPQLRARVTWPHGSSPPAAVPLTGGDRLPKFGATRAIAVRHGDELLGAITIEKPKNEPVSAAEDKLLAHLASQAGLVLRNVRLTAELQATIDDLRASRRRLVRAQDEERQRIERNLHDGAQQQLVALMIQLAVLDDAADDPAEVRELTGELKDGLHAALDDLRALARGIYPPLLAEQGLGAAVRAQAGPRFRSWSRRTGSAATGGTPKPPPTSASWRRCKTSRNTPVLRPPRSPCPAPMATSSSPSATTATALTPQSPQSAPACKAWPTGWPRSAAPSASAPPPGSAPP